MLWDLSTIDRSLIIEAILVTLKVVWLAELMSWIDIA